jgi:hypothetical protein
MKSNINATIDPELIDAIEDIRRRERRTLNNVVETALTEYIHRQKGDGIVTSCARFSGKFSRGETYARSKR